MRKRRRQHGQDVGALVRASLRRGDVTGWFEELYRAAGDDLGAVPWHRGALHAYVSNWLRERLDLVAAPSDLGPCLVVGCGLGDDAASLARVGIEVTAFDVAPTAVNWARARHPDADVRWVTADLLGPPAAWHQAFRTVVEVRTLQSLPADVREQAARSIAGFVAPGGELVAVALTAVSETAARAHEGPPWAVPPAHIEALAEGLEVVARGAPQGEVSEVGYVLRRPEGA